MAFVHRKLYRQKPKQWGPFSAVKRSLFHNAEKIGLPRPVGFWPIFEGAGNIAHDYSGNNQHVILTNVSWSIVNGYGLYFNGTNSYGYTPLITTIPAGDDYTQIIRLKEVETENTEACIYLGNSLAQTYASRLEYRGDKLYNRHEYVDGTAISYDLPGESWGDQNYLGTFQHFACGLNAGYIQYFFNESLSNTSVTAVNERDINRLYWGAQYGSSNFWEGYLDTHLLFDTWLSDEVRQLLYDNPYILLQPVPQKTYFLPSESQAGVLPIKYNIDEITKGVGPITAAQLGGALVGG